MRIVSHHAGQHGTVCIDLRRPGLAELYLLVEYGSDVHVSASNSCVTAMRAFSTRLPRPSDLLDRRGLDSARVQGGKMVWRGQTHQMAVGSWCPLLGTSSSRSMIKLTTLGERICARHARGSKMKFWSHKMSLIPLERIFQ